jgi:hypothetical protein
MGVKVIHLLKMTWMFTWRLLIVSTLLFGSRYNDSVPLLAFGVAAVLVFGFNKTLLTWPLIRLFRGRSFIEPAGGFRARTPKRSKPTKRRPTRPQVEQEPARPQIGSATANGRITGFEPRALEVKPVPRFPTMYGVPGEGLDGAVNLSAENVKLGIKGERNFARALGVARKLGDYHTIWSVPVPDQVEFKPGPYGTDIDCILATGEAIFLIDLKNYKSGDVRYYNRGNQLYCEDVPTGKQVGEPKTMSRNMEMATSAVRKHCPNAEIWPVVVFMPTDKGEGVIDKVNWPGQVPAVNLSEFLEIISKQPKFEWSAPTGGSFARLTSLQKMKR